MSSNPSDLNLDLTGIHELLKPKSPDLKSLFHRPLSQDEKACADLEVKVPNWSDDDLATAMNKPMSWLRELRENPEYQKHIDELKSEQDRFTRQFQSMNETEIAHELNVDQSTISRDVKALKALSQRFVFDLAKSDLAYYYKQCIDGIEEVRRKGWDIFKGLNDNGNLTPRDKLLALKIIKECNEAKFALFKEGPSIMHIKSLEERLESIESRQINK